MKGTLKVKLPIYFYGTAIDLRNRITQLDSAIVQLQNTISSYSHFNRLCLFARDDQDLTQ